MLHRHILACCAAVGMSLCLTGCDSVADLPQKASGHTDEFPSGIATPEGVAADLVRAYINRDSRLFNNSRHVRMCEGPDNPAKYYALFLNNAEFANGSKTFNIDTLPNPLRRISKVFVARSLAPQDEYTKATLELGFKMNFLEDRKFVDVVAVDSCGTEFLHRTVVEKHPGGVWFAVPQLNAMHNVLKPYALSTEELWSGNASEWQNAK